MAPKRETCRRCGKRLVGRQRQFCSLGAGSCSKRAWEERNPRRRVSVGEIPQGPLWARVLGALQDHQPHTADEIGLAVHASAHSVVTRISELQARGHRIVSDLPRGNCMRAHRYTLVAD